MKTKKKLEFIQTEVEKIISKAEKLETEHAESLSAVLPVCSESALNLLHYLAFRSFESRNCEILKKSWLGIL